MNNNRVTITGASTPRKSTNVVNFETKGGRGGIIVVAHEYPKGEQVSASQTAIVSRQKPLPCGRRKEVRRRRVESFCIVFLDGLGHYSPGTDVEKAASFIRVTLQAIIPFFQP